MKAGKALLLAWLATLLLASPVFPQKSGSRLEISGNVSMLIQNKYMVFADKGEVIGDGLDSPQQLKLAGSVKLCGKNVFVYADSLLVKSKGDEMELNGNVVFSWGTSGLAFADNASYNTVTGVSKLVSRSKTKAGFYILPSAAGAPDAPDAQDNAGGQQESPEALQKECKEKSAAPAPKVGESMNAKNTDKIEAREITLLSLNQEAAFNDSVEADIASKNFKLSAGYMKVGFDGQRRIKTMTAVKNVNFTDGLRKGRADQMDYNVANGAINLKGNASVDTPDGRIEAQSVRMTAGEEGRTNIEAPKNQFFKLIK